MKIVMIATYPWDTPRHGGQHRMHNIGHALRSAGHIVQDIGVLGSEHYAPSPGFLKFPGQQILSRYAENPSLVEDWALGELFANDDAYFEALFSQIEDTPDLILIGHPWLFKASYRYISSISSNRPKIIYDSHNVENNLKYEITKNYFAEHTALFYKNAILETEIYAIEKSDAISCVSDDDKMWISNHASCPVILAKNGVSNRSMTEHSLHEVNKITQGRKFALYCGSAHPPNLFGFYSIFEDGIASFSPEQRLVVAGAAANYIMDAPQFAKTGGLRSIYLNAGEVNEDCLAGLLKTAHAIILPITQGGGTNLKSAEAIWSGKHIIATSMAMRGLEEFTTLPGVHIANSPSAFKQALRDVMLMPSLTLCEKDFAKRKAVLWQNTLADLIRFVHLADEDRQ